MQKTAFASYLLKCYSSRKKSNTGDWKVVIKVLASFACDPTPTCPAYRISHACTSFFQVMEEFLVVILENLYLPGIILC